MKKAPEKKVLLIEKGQDIYHRNCPVLQHKLEKCPIDKNHYSGCFPSCAMTNGFGGAGAYSDGKFNITTEFGGWLSDVLDDEVLKKFMKDVINMSWDGFNLHEWEKEKLDEMVAYNREQQALKDGIKQGIEQGIEQGIKQNIEQTIKEMLKNNLDLKLIAKVTNKSVDEIIEIQDSIIIDKENLS